MEKSEQEILLLIGAGTLLLWLICYLIGRIKYAGLVKRIGKNSFLLEPVFFVGIAALSILPFQMDSTRAVKKQRELMQLYGRKQAKAEYLFLRGGQMSYVFTIIPISCFLAAFVANRSVLMLGVIVIAGLCMIMERSYKRALSEKHDRILMEFPAVLSKLALLVSSGMVLRDAWIMVSGEGSGVLCEEMKRVSEEMENGVSETDAYRGFAERCQLREIRHFTSTVVQNLKKGNAELSVYLRDMSHELWLAKEGEIKKKAELAAQGMLFPSVLVFVSILIMIMVPMLAGLDF